MAIWGLISRVRVLLSGVLMKTMIEVLGMKKKKMDLCEG